MKHLGYARKNYLIETKKILPSIILPPLQPSFPEEFLNIRKNMVNKKSGSVPADIVVSRPSEIPTWPADVQKSPEQSRIAQLEQNIKFLQEQHQLMLAGLHNEIDNLKMRNRELQFQLVFVKTSSSSSSASSPEDENKHKPYSSPKPFNTTPLQVELLEKELGELKLQMNETESRNAYLSAIVDEQKKKLERYERDREKERDRAGQPDPEILRKLDDAEVIIRRLRRETSELRRENSAGQCSYVQNGYSSSRSGRNGHTSRGNGRYRGNWFPPLHSQSYWQSGRNHQDRSAQGETSSESLPSLQNNDGHYQSRRNSNNNHYNNGENRKYRGGAKNSRKQT